MRAQDQLREVPAVTLVVDGYLIECAECETEWLFIEGQHTTCPYCGCWETCHVCEAALHPLRVHYCGLEESDDEQESTA